jgi:hypothetical protein
MQTKPCEYGHPNVQVVRRGGFVKPRPATRLFGGPSLAVGFFAPTVENLYRAVVERYYLEKVDGQYREIRGPRSPALFQGRLRTFRRRIQSSLSPVIPWAPRQFAEAYRGDRRFGRYLAAAVSLEARALDVSDCNVDAFVKKQKECFATPFGRDDGWKVDVVPRAIYPRGPRYTVEVGRYLKPLEKPIYRAVDQAAGYTCVAKGLNFWERAKVLHDHWRHFNDPVCVKMDAHRYESHHGEQALRYEHAVYYSAVSKPHSLPLRKALQAQYRFRGTGRCDDGKIRFQVIGGKRASGDWNTALGNTLVSSSMIWSYARAQRIPIRFLSDGDDVVVICERRHARRLMDGVRDWYAAMGFVMDVAGPVDQFERIVFCNTSPVEITAGEWCMTRTAISAFAKDFVCLAPVRDEDELRAWCSAVAAGGTALAGAVPIFGALYDAYRRFGAGVPPMAHPLLEDGFAHHAAMMGERAMCYTEPTAVCRASFWAAYGITPAEQVAIEQDLKCLAGPTGKWVDVGDRICSAYLHGCKRWPGLC